MFSEVVKNGVTYKTSTNISCLHAFTTRLGGVSSGIYSSLNLGQSLGDDPINVRANYGALCNALGICTYDIVKSKQVHGTTIRLITSSDCGKLYDNDIPEADGMITNINNVALIIYTADCVPILLHDSKKNVVCALHAGWRGTVKDICGIAVKKMLDAYGSNPSDIKASIGPCIGNCCFETSIDVVDALYNTLENSADLCYEKYGNKYKVNLKMANKIMLSRVSVEDISISSDCTSCNDKYWSHRKVSTKRGSQASIIALGDKT